MDTSSGTRESCFAFIGRYGVVLAWGVLIALFGVLLGPSFLAVSTFQTIFGTQAVLLILALGLLVALVVGEFDLSIVGVMSMSVMIVGVLNVLHGWPIWLAVLTAQVSGVAIGMLNALLVLRLGINSMVVTLGAGTFWSGVGYGLYATTIPGVDTRLSTAVNTRMGGLPLGFYYAAALTVALWYVVAFTPLGRYLHFVGANRTVSRLSGIRVDLIRGGSLVVSATLAAFAGVVLVGMLGASTPSASSTYLLPAFAAVFLGTTTIQVGKFNPWGTFVAVYFLITGITGLQLYGFSGWVVDVFYGGALVASVALSRIFARKGAR
ncbi:ABC transporter permease [Streptomyces naphthomycinicus]|uniref:ABC transporter permease n=1 Tax=Streptomyces naphthomycinicus TaxID=2872625 RepID=UPI001CECC63D|nr:ABC transporter permease [Streptomyces sp. TML10]